MIALMAHACLTDARLTFLMQAIRYAVNEWEVDLIVLPMGIREHDQNISSAVLEARQKSVIVVAPTGNSGGNERVAFPARMAGVIAVNATDGHGNPSSFNPSPRKARKNFSTLGELIPSKTLNDRTSYITGTSYAALVAASILSIVIQFARNRLQMTSQDLRWLNSPEGAETLLELMSVERGGYDYVAPWLFFSGEIDEEMTQGSEAEFINIMRGRIVAAMKRIR
jgi:subtilisin family serine protease